MVRRTRGRGNVIPHTPELLDAMGAFRRKVLDASTEVQPFGTAYHALSMVATAIDALGTFITGQPDYFSIAGSSPSADNRGDLR